jgi:hypothetical protein
MSTPGVRQRRSLRYIRLAAFFAGQPIEIESISLTVAEIEGLVGQPLPGNSRFPSWWRNDIHKMHSRAWLTAGWEVKGMDAATSTVTFTRGSEPPEIVL